MGEEKMLVTELYQNGKKIRWCSSSRQFYDIQWLHHFTYYAFFFFSPSTYLPTFFFLPWHVISLSENLLLTISLTNIEWNSLKMHRSFQDD